MLTSHSRDFALYFFSSFSITRVGAVFEESDQTYLAETDTVGALKSLHAARALIGLRSVHALGKKC